MLPAGSGTDEPRLGLSIFLLRRDQVAACEAKVIAGRDVLALAAPLDGVFLPLTSTPAEPRWVTLVRSILASPAALALRSGC